MKIGNELENPLRIKITGDCNRNCFFCHKEGGMDIDTIHFSDDLRYLIEDLSAAFNISSVALTGGEPLVHEDLIELSRHIIKCKGIEKISITTNGTIPKSEEFWTSLKSNGLYKVNISMPDILQGMSYKGKNLEDVISKGTVFDNQMNMIRTLNELGIGCKVNVAVINDEFYTLSVINQLLGIKDLKFSVVLLPNIMNEGTYLYSKKIINRLIRMLGLRKAAVRTRNHTSDTVIEYLNSEGVRLFIKTTKLGGHVEYLQTMCENCPVKEKCQEGFYGVRVEQRKGELYIRLCIHRNADDTLIPYNRFKDTDIFRELKECWGS